MKEASLLVPENLAIRPIDEIGFGSLLMIPVPVLPGLGLLCTTTPTWFIVSSTHSLSENLAVLIWVYAGSMETLLPIHG